WFGTSRGVIRMNLSSPTEAGVVSTVARLPETSQAVVSHDVIAITRPGGLSYGRGSEPVALPSYPSGADAELAVPGPDGAVWVGTTLSGLILRKPGQDLQLTKEGGLPSMTVTALARKVVGTGKSLRPDSANVWVGTSAGVALVHTDGHALQ